MLSKRINVLLIETHEAAFFAFGARITKPDEVMKTPDILLALIETTPEYEALTGIKSEYGKNPQPRPIDDIESDKTGTGD